MLGGNYIYSENSLEINQPELRMIPTNLDGHYLIQFNHGAPQYRPQFLPTSPYYSNLPPPPPPPLTFEEIPHMEDIQSDLNVNAPEFIPKFSCIISEQGGTSNWVQGPPSEPVDAPNNILVENCSANLLPNLSEYSPGIEFLQKDEVNENSSDIIEQSGNFEENNLAPQLLQDKKFEPKSFTQLSEEVSWRDHGEINIRHTNNGDNQGYRTHRTVQTGYRERSDKTRPERTSDNRKNRNNYERNWENNENRRPFSRGQNLESNDQIELRQERVTNTEQDHRYESEWENKPNQTRLSKSRDQLESYEKEEIRHERRWETRSPSQRGYSRGKDFRPERNSSYRQNRQDYSTEKSERGYVDKRGVKHNSDEHQTEGFQGQTKYNGKGSPKDLDQAEFSSKRNQKGMYPKSYQDETTEHFKQKMYSEIRQKDRIMKEKYGNRRGNIFKGKSDVQSEDLDSQVSENSKSAEENWFEENTKEYSKNNSSEQTEYRLNERGLNKKWGAKKEEVENVWLLDDESKRKRSGSESLESTLSFEEQKPDKENRISDKLKKANKYKQNLQEYEEPVPPKTTGWDETEFKKQRAKRRTFEMRKSYKEENSFDLSEDKKKYRDLKIERDSTGSPKSYFEEKYGRSSLGNSFEEKYGRSSLGRTDDKKIIESFDKDYELQDEEYKEFLTELSNNIICEPIKITEKEQDLFELPTSYSLAHCVAEDFRMSCGIAVDFKKNFQRVEELLNQRKRTGGLAVLKDSERYIYYLVTKRRSSNKPSYKDFWCSVKDLRDHIKQNNIKQLGIPRLGCGLDRLHWPTVKHIIEFLFKNVDVEILYCKFAYNEETAKRDSDCIIVYNCDEKLVDITEKSVILYFSSADGEITDEMRELDEKYNLVNDFKKEQKNLGKIIKHDTDPHLLCGCITRKNSKTKFDFRSFKKCIDEINRLTENDEYTGVAMNFVYDDRDIFLYHKICTMLIHYLKYVDVYVYKEKGNTSLDET